MKRLLYQLSYSAEMVVPARLERATARLSGVCSNQLSYETVNGGTGESRTHIIQLRYLEVETPAGTVPKFSVFPECQIDCLHTIIGNGTPYPI